MQARPGPLRGAILMPPAGGRSTAAHCGDGEVTASMARKQVKYDEKAIKTLDALEHIRLRTGMYIGRIGDGSNPADGIYVMLKEVVDNAIDEFIMGHGQEDRDPTRRRRGDGARLRPRHPARQGRRLRHPDQHGRQVQRRRLPVLGRPQRRRQQGGQRPVERVRGRLLPRRQVQAGGLRTRAQAPRGGRRATASRQRYPDPIRSRPGDLRGVRLARGVHRAPAAVLRLPQHRPDAWSTTASDSAAGTVSPTCSPRRSARSRRSTRSSTAARTGSSSPSPTPTPTARPTSASSTASTPTTAAPTRAPSARACSRVSTSSAEALLCRRGRARRAASARWRSSSRIRSSRARPRTSSGRREVRSWIVNAVREQVVLWLHKNPEAADASAATRSATTSASARSSPSIKKEARERAKKVAIRIPKLIDCKVHLERRQG